jgi:hypothetical protein
MCIRDSREAVSKLNVYEMEKSLGMRFLE